MLDRENSQAFAVVRDHFKIVPVMKQRMFEKVFTDEEFHLRDVSRLNDFSLRFIMKTTRLGYF